MKAVFLTYLMGVCCCLTAFPAAAQEDWSDENPNLVSLYATACEPVKTGEPKSSVRVRATDKASYKAVEKISELSDYRNSFSSHDYNVLVYHIVDNYIEDLASRTIEQDASQICVEVTGYLNNENIIRALNENYNKFELSQLQKEPEEYPDRLEIEDKKSAEVPVVTGMPPKPEPEIRREIAAETVIGEADNNENLPAVFIDRTEFFNNTSTAAYYDEIKKVLTGKKEIRIVTDAGKADYVVKTKVLRAKVDPINKQTSRLQMVLAAELVDNGSGTSVVEHQNRFILFESSDDEQAVASGLMLKLLRKAAGQISGKIKDSAAAENAAMITPSQPNYRRPSPNRQPD